MGNFDFFVWIFCRGRIWTLLFDLFAGIMIMLFLWRISNADEYLMQFTMVN